MDTIRWCAESITRNNLQELKTLAKPPQLVKDVLEAVALLLGQPETRWDKLKRLIASPSFLERVQKLSLHESVSRERFKKLRERLQRDDFDEEVVKTVCVPVVPLAMWCRAIGVFLSKTKFRGGPEIRPIAAAATPSPPERTARRRTSNDHMVFDPEIRFMDAEELSRVSELTICRPGVGKISFHGITDCSALDVERCVRLELGEVLVYPDASMKPPVGTGLNKAATITLYQCWPPDGSSVPQDGKSQERYRQKIKQMTEDKHATFLDYDCITGVWQFKVDHF